MRDSGNSLGKRSFGQNKLLPSLSVFLPAKKTLLSNSSPTVSDAWPRGRGLIPRTFLPQIFHFDRFCKSCDVSLVAASSGAFLFAERHSVEVVSREADVQVLMGCPKSPCTNTILDHWCKKDCHGGRTIETSLLGHSSVLIMKQLQTVSLCHLTVGMKCEMSWSGRNFARGLAAKFPYTRPG